jgi:plasmid stabilization system protein ParE
MSRQAEMDLAEITDFIARDNPARAFKFEEELVEHARKIERAPLAYVERTDLGHRLRSCAHGAYVIFFTVNDPVVRIERILHGSRDLARLLNE